MLQPESGMSDPSLIMLLIEDDSKASVDLC